MNDEVLEILNINVRSISANLHELNKTVDLQNSYIERIANSINGGRKDVTLSDFEQMTREYAERYIIVLDVEFSCKFHFRSSQLFDDRWVLKLYVDGLSHGEYPSLLKFCENGLGFRKATISNLNLLTLTKWLEEDE